MAASPSSSSSTSQRDGSSNNSPTIPQHGDATPISPTRIISNGFFTEDGSPLQKDRGKDVVLGVLEAALNLANEAVALDAEQESAKKVLPFYEKAIQAIDTALRLLPEEAIQQTTLRGHREAYRARVDVLRSVIEAADRQGGGSGGGGGDSQAPSSPGGSKKHHVVHPFAAVVVDPMGYQKMEDVPPALVRRPYWMMRTIRQTIITGGYLTPRLYVPKEVWMQAGVKISGASPKIAAMESLLYNVIENLVTQPLPGDEAGRTQCRATLEAFRAFTHKVQNDLARPFPFIPEVDTATDRTSPPPGGGMMSLHPAKAQLGRLHHLVRNVGRNVKNTAVVAVERIGASVPGKVADNEQLVYYSQLVSEVCSKCQVLDEWFVHLERARREEGAGKAGTGAAGAEGTGAGPAGSSPTAKPPGGGGWGAGRSRSSSSSNIAELVIELHHIAEFMRVCVCEMVVRDLETIVEKYLRAMRKSYSRFAWDDSNPPLDD